MLLNNWMGEAYFTSTKTKNAEIIVIVPNNLITVNYRVPESLLYCFYLYSIS